MKRIIAICALVGVLLQTFSQVVIVAQYYANKDYIAKNLCENRNKPQMHCEGKCCLKKKLARDAKEQAPTSKSQKEKETVNLFFALQVLNINHHLPIPVKATYFNRNELQTCSVQLPVFHPPAV